MFFPNSRYHKQSTYLVARADGTLVAVTRLPLSAPGRLLGFHRRHEGQRLDMIAAHYLADATTFWQLCDANNQIIPDALAAHDLVGIPVREG
jgi:hypothetical protein